MEIAHRQPGVLRLIGKLVLIGFFVLILAKAILTLLALAVVGILTCLCARALYVHRAFFGRILLWTEKALSWSIIAVFRVSTAAVVAAGCLLFVCASLLRRCAWTGAKRSIRHLDELAAATPSACTVVGTQLSQTARTSGVQVWRWTRWFLKVLTLAPLAIILTGSRIAGAFAHLSVRGCLNVTRVAGAAWVRVRDQSSVICGTLVEATSGALVGAMLPNLESVHGVIFLPGIDRTAIVCAAALFGAFLGIALGLSRITWAKERDMSHENQD